MNSTESGLGSVGAAAGGPVTHYFCKYIIRSKLKNKKKFNKYLKLLQNYYTL